MTNEKLKRANEIARQIEHYEWLISRCKEEGKFDGAECLNLIDTDADFRELINNYMSNTINEKLDKFKKEFEQL